MMWTHTIKGLGLAGLMAGVASAQVAPPAQPAAARVVQQPAAVQRAPVQGQAVTPSPTQVSRQLSQIPQVIDGPQDLRDAARMAFMTVDADNNGLISQEEAIDAANIAVGGIFFAADGNGDGKVSRDEAKSAREKVMRQQPLLRILVQRVKREQPSAADANNPIRGIATLLDSDSDKELSATEVRDVVKSVVQGLFAAGDTNRDGQMSPDEVNAAALGLAQAAGEAAFSLADADSDGKLSQDEFLKALEEPAKAVFTVLDVDGDKQITEQEAQKAREFIMTQMIPQIPRAQGGAPIPNVSASVSDPNVNLTTGTQPQPPARNAVGR